MFKDPTSTKAFLTLLQNVQKDAKHEMDKIAQVFLMNNDASTRALALQQKGKVEFLQEFTTLIQSVVK